MSVSLAEGGWTPAFENAVAQLNEKDKRAFDQALVSCDAYKNRSFKKFEFTPHEVNVFLGTAGDVNYAAEKVLSNGWQEGTVVFRQTRGTGMYLYELLNSYGFMIAMKKCFDNNLSKENRYVAELILIDAAVKGIYMGGTYLSIKYLLARRWGMALLTTLVVAPISGSTPKPQELSMIERVQRQLDTVTDLVQEHVNGKGRLP